MINDKSIPLSEEDIRKMEEFEKEHNFDTSHAEFLKELHDNKENKNG